VIGKRHFKNVWTASLLLLLCFLLFGNTLDHPFMLDDKALIVKNDALFDPGYLQFDVFSAGGHKVEGGQYVYFRPVAHLLTALPAYFFGVDPFPYRLMNLILFYIACLSLYAFLKVLFKDPDLCLLATVLFCVHPMNGMLVNYISASGYSVMIILMNAALLCFLKAQEIGSRLVFIVSLLLFVLSLLCHETAIAFPLYLAAALYLVKKQSLKVTVLACAPFVIMAVIYVWFRQHYAVFPVLLSKRLDMIGTTFAGFVATYFHSILWYVKGLLTTKDIALLWSAPVVKDHVLWQNLGFWTAFAVSLYVILFRLCREAALGLSWLVIGLMLVVMASLSRPSYGVLMEPHWLFFATIGFCIMVAALTLKLAAGSKPVLMAVCVLVLLVNYGASTLYYNDLWADEERYGHYINELSPHVSITSFWLGYFYMSNGDLDQAEQHFLQAIKKYSSDWEPYTNLGLIAKLKGDSEKAQEYYRKAISINPTAPEPRVNLAADYIDSGHYERARKLLVETLEHNPYHNPARKNLAVVYIRMRRLDKAKELVDEIREVDPSDKDADKIEEIINMLEEEGA